MFESLISWCRFPVNVHCYTGVDIAGDPSYSAPVLHSGYRVDEMRTIVDKYGANYVSHTTVYLPPDVEIKESDCISFPDDTARREIRKLGGYFDGNTGALSIRVVYL